MLNSNTYNSKPYNAPFILAAPAYITITSVSHYAVSAQLGFDVSTVKFISDIFLLSWVARATKEGADYDHATGVLVGDGGNLAANAEGFFVVEHNEIVNMGDGVHRISVYGKNESGVWSDEGGGGS